ncbi:hypothetical protein M422DRAFT_73890 [Sphaerobolus stellatus SS14]|nr:hypothetical protein M422DRAFT_73890 [Sphaerobolus stellatus SS14]
MPEDKYGFYELQLIILAAYCAFALITQRYLSSRKSDNEQGDVPTPGWRAAGGETPGYRTLMKKYLLVYAVVMGADWLQGPYVYSLYNEQYEFPERIVALLFVTGFTAGGITAPLVGVWADQYGRKRLCMIFCVTYALSCACTLFPSFIVLFCGRILGGLSTSILFSSFESWLVGSSTTLGLSNGELSTIMGRATLTNGFVATAAGILSNNMVSATRNFQTPFMASGVVLILAWVMIKGSWSENFGSSTGETDIFQIARLKVAWQIVRKDASLLTLVLTQTCFEGSMYLFVFLWVPALRELATESLPLGYIFSSFMVCMMLGSLIYTTIVSFPPASDTADSSLALHAKLSSLVCALSALSLVTSVVTYDPRYRFWAFCVFEACVGMYYPIQGMLRSSIISDEHRATLSALSRVPLNIFVTVSLLTGVSDARAMVFGGSAVALFVSALMTTIVIVRRTENLSRTSQSSLQD